MVHPKPRPPSLLVLLLAVLLALAACAGNGGAGAKGPLLERVLIVYRSSPGGGLPAGAASSAGSRNFGELLPHLFARLPSAFEEHGVKARMVLESGLKTTRTQPGEKILWLQPEAASAQAAAGQPLTLLADLMESGGRETLWWGQVRIGLAGVGQFDDALADSIGQRMITALRSAGWPVAPTAAEVQRAAVAATPAPQAPAPAPALTPAPLPVPAPVLAAPAPAAAPVTAAAAPTVSAPAAPAVPAAPVVPVVPPAPARSAAPAVAAASAASPNRPPDRYGPVFPVTPAQVVRSARRAASAPAGAAAAQPAGSGFARLENVDAIPYLNERGRKSYLDWLQRAAPRAFAIASDGHWSSTWGERSGNAGLPADVAQRALLLCERLAHVPCKLYAVNNTVVWVSDPP